MIPFRLYLPDKLTAITWQSACKPFSQSAQCRRGSRRLLHDEPLFSIWDPKGCKEREREREKTPFEKETQRKREVRKRENGKERMREQEYFLTEDRIHSCRNV